jgi:hypothetical protein
VDRTKFESFTSIKTRSFAMGRPEPGSKIIRPLVIVTCCIVGLTGLIIRYVREPVLPTFANDPPMFVKLPPPVPAPTPMADFDDRIKLAPKLSRGPPRPRRELDSSLQAAMGKKVDRQTDKAV